MEQVARMEQTDQVARSEACKAGGQGCGAEVHHSKVEKPEDPHGGVEDHHSKSGETVTEGTEKLRLAPGAKTRQVGFLDLLGTFDIQQCL